MSATTRLSARELDSLVASQARVTDDDLAGLLDSPAATALFDSLVSEGLGPAELVALPHRQGRRSGAPALVAAAALLVAAVLAPLLALRSSSPSGAGTGVKIAMSTKSGAQFTAVVPRHSVIHGIPDWQSLPAFIYVDVGGKVVGRVQRSDLDQSASSAATGASGASGASGAGGFVCGEGSVPVYNGQMQQVGGLYPGAGYVPRGAKVVCGQGVGTPTLSTLVPSQQCAVATAGNITQCGTDGSGETKGG